MITLVPADTPVTKPELFTIATDGVAEIHGLVKAGVPDPVKLVVEPAQTIKVPVMVGSEFTVAVTAVRVADKHPFADASA